MTLQGWLVMGGSRHPMYRLYTKLILFVNQPASSSCRQPWSRQEKSLDLLATAVQVCSGSFFFVSSSKPGVSTSIQDRFSRVEQAVSPSHADLECPQGSGKGQAKPTPNSVCARQKRTLHGKNSSYQGPKGRIGNVKRRGDYSKCANVTRRWEDPPEARVCE